MPNNIEDSELIICQKLHDDAEKQIESLLQLFNNIKTIYKIYYGKDCKLEYRIKTPEKMLIKLQLRRQEGKNINPQNIPDIIGLRLSVDTEDDVIELSSLLESIIEVADKKDYFTKPTPTGFKANLYRFGFNNSNVEVQVMTKEMALWTNQTHDEYDQRTYGLTKNGR